MSATDMLKSYNSQLRWFIKPLHLWGDLSAVTFFPQKISSRFYYYSLTRFIKKTN